MTEVAVTEVLGESLSPSQVTTYLTCPSKWYFRYLIGLGEPATGTTQPKIPHRELRLHHDRRVSSIDLQPRGGCWSTSTVS